MAFNIKDVTAKAISGLKKTIVYSSDKEKSFVEGALNILSVTEKKSASAVLEDLVADALLPANETARYICRSLYASESNNLGALESIFGMYAAGLNGCARYQNGLELVEYLHNYLMFVEYSLDERNKSDREYFCQNFYQIYKVVEEKLATDHEDSLVVPESPVKYTKFLLDEAKDEPEFFKFMNFTQLLIDHWDILGNSTYTFRALVAVCRITKEQKMDSAEDRVKLVKLISKTSEEWE